MVCTVFCGFVVVQNEQILTEQIVIVNVRQFMLCTGRIGQRYLLDWVGNAVNQIAYRKVQVFAGFRLFLNLKGWSLCIYNMNRNQCCGSYACCVLGGYTDKVTAVGTEVILVGLDGQGSNCVAGMICLTLGKFQIIIPGALVLVIAYQLYGTLLIVCGIRCNVVKPLLVRIRSVVEHDDNILSQFGGNRITRMRIRDSLGAEGSLFGFGADVALDVVIRQIVIPNCQRTMLDEIIRQIMVTGVNCTVHLGAEVGSLSLISAGQGDRTRLCHERELDDRAVIGYRSSIFCYISTINGDDGIFLGEAGAEGKRQICACIGRYDLRVCNLGLDSRIAAARRAAGGRTAARSRAANRLGLTCGNRFIAGLDAGNAVCCGNLGAGGGNGYVIGVRLYGSNLACTGNLCAFCVDVDGTDRRAAVYGNGRTLCDYDVVNRAGNRNVGIGDNALAGLGVLEGYTAFAAAQHNAAGDSNTRQVDSADAVCNDEIAVDGLAGQGNAVFTHNNAAVHRGRQRIVCIGVGAGHLTDDLGKFRTGDVGFRVQLTICTVDIAVFDQCSYTALCPCRDRSTIGVIVQNGRIAAFKRKCTREDNKSFFTGDRRFGIQFAVCTLKCAHGNGQFEIVVIPCRSVCIAVNRQISCFASGKGTVDDSSHLGTNQQAGAVNLAV